MSHGLHIFRSVEKNLSSCVASSLFLLAALIKFFLVTLGVRIFQITRAKANIRSDILTLFMYAWTQIADGLNKLELHSF